MSEETRPPGICEQCLASNAVVLFERVVVVHCAHAHVGAIGQRQADDSLFWITHSPIDRERFEQLVTETLRDVGTG
jgi:hypothetical protein